MSAPQDLFHNLQPITAIAPQSLGATASGGKVSRIIDREGFDRVLFVADYGSITATNASVTVAVKDCAVTSGPFVAVSAGALLGTLAGVGVGATSARVSHVSKNVTKTIEYVGLNRYIEVTMAPGASGGIIAGLQAILGNPRRAPVLNAG